MILGEVDRVRLGAGARAVLDGELQGVRAREIRTADEPENEHGQEQSELDHGLAEIVGKHAQTENAAHFGSAV